MKPATCRRVGRTVSLQTTAFEATVETEVGVYATFGSFGKDFDGEYVEFGYGTTVSDIDLGVAFIFSDDQVTRRMVKAPLVFRLRVSIQE